MGLNGRYPALDWPDWVPMRARWYLEHTRHGQSLRALARASGHNPSTVLRQVRRLETLRDDPLFDAALSGLETPLAAPMPDPLDPDLEREPMTAPLRPLSDALLAHQDSLPDGETVAGEARRILRRLAERDAILALAPGLEQAAVLRFETGVPVRTATVTRAVVEVFALNEWISPGKRGRVHQYRLTDLGRRALARLEAEARGASPGEDTPAPFAEQHRDMVTRRDAEGELRRQNLAESPLGQLARRKDATGKRFLSPRLVAAGERLREDFELAQMGSRVTQNWDRFLTAGVHQGQGRQTSPHEGPRKARERVRAALDELGPGLGDVALRCCCHLEGLEATEKRLGWSARSGKIVLRIALQRLARHYDARDGVPAPLIGG